MELIASGNVHLYLCSNYLFTSNGVLQDHGARLVKGFGKTGKIEIQDDCEGTKYTEMPYDTDAHALLFMNVENYLKFQNTTPFARLDFLAEDECCRGILKMNQQHFVSGVREAQFNVAIENKRMDRSENRRMRSENNRLNKLLDEIENITKKRRLADSSTAKADDDEVGRESFNPTDIATSVERISRRRNEAAGAKSSSSEATGVVVQMSMLIPYNGWSDAPSLQSDAPSLLFFPDERDVPDWVPRNRDKWNEYAIFGEDDNAQYGETDNPPHCEATMNKRLACIDELVNQGKARFMHVSGKITVDKIVANTLSNCYEECRFIEY